jgi:hypothetical protein
MLRFRPDRAFVKVGGRSVLCEIKSEDQGRPNFAIEIDSYRAALEWNMTWQHVMYAFVDLASSTNAVYCCWANDVPTPKAINVPRRWDFEKTYRRLQDEWPGVDLRLVPHRSGAGTPYFLVWKRSNFLVPIDTFITQFIQQIAAKAA